MIKVEDIELIAEIKSLSRESVNSHSESRLYTALTAKALTVGLHKKATLMKKAEVVAIRPTKKHSYPETGKESIKALNALNRLFCPSTLHTHWLCDITYIETHQGWSYLACVLELASKEIVGWAMS